MSKQVGYGVIQNGKPAGIWPIPLSHAWALADRRAQENPGVKIDVVQVLHSDPLPRSTRAVIDPTPEKETKTA
jgi:hypothetical protein